MTPALRFLSNQVWALHPPIFDLLSKLLSARASGRQPAAFDDGGEKRPAAGEPKPYVSGSTAVVPVRGVIARYADQVNGSCQEQGRSAELLQRDLLTMAGDPRVRRIVLRIDSPGGTVAGTAETGDVIRRISASGMPVIAYVDGMAASAAYWLASQADEIVMAGPTSEVGSIGVITAYIDSTKAQDAEGYRFQVFRTSPLKAPGAWGESLTPEQAAAINRDLVDFHAAFASAVQAGRGLTDAQLAAATTGEMWRPAAAIAMGLADRVATFAELLSESLTPAAAAATAQESSMDAKTQAGLAALSENHPDLAVKLIAAANKPGATEADLEALVTREVSAAKDAQIAKLGAELADQKKAHADALAAKDAEIAEWKKKASVAGGAGEDPGAGPAAGKPRRSQMKRAEKAAFVKEHGQDAYNALPY